MDNRTPAQIACDTFLSWASPGARLTHLSQTDTAMHAWEMAVKSVMLHEPASRDDILESARRRAQREHRAVEDVLLDMLVVSAGEKVSGTLLIVAPENSNEEERNRIANDLSKLHDGPVLVFAHGWRTMTEEDLANLRNILNKSDKAMLDLLDTCSDKLDKPNLPATLGE